MDRRSFVKLVGGLVPLSLVKVGNSNLADRKEVESSPEPIGFHSDKGRYFSRQGNFSVHNAYCYECKEHIEPCLIQYAEWIERGGQVQANTVNLPSDEQERWKIVQSRPMLYLSTLGYGLEEPPDDSFYAVCSSCNRHIEHLAAACTQCGHRWNPNVRYLQHPLRCPACGYWLKLFCDGERMWPSNIGDWMGQYAWCSVCEGLTLNSPFKVGRVSDEEWELLGPKQRASPGSYRLITKDSGWLCHVTKTAYVSRDTIGYFFTRCGICGCRKNCMYVIPLDRCKNVTVV